MIHKIHQTPEQQLAESSNQSAELLQDIKQNTLPKDVQKVALEGISLVSIKGDKGDKGETGLQGTQGFVGPQGIGIQGTQGERGEKGVKGDKGLKGDNGEKGLDGKNGSPDTTEQLFEKLNTAKNSLNFEILTNIPDFALARDINMASGIGGGGGPTITFQDEGTTITENPILKLNVTGSGGNITYSGSGLATLTLTGGVGAFTDLTDVPNSYSGAGSKGVRVNAGATALEFYTVVDTDEKVKYAADDAAAGYLGAKTVAGTGITLAEGTVGDADKLVITNSAPDQTVALTAGTNITSVTGTYPNFTINAATQTGGGDMLKSDNLSGLANYTTARSNLGLVIGTDVQAYNSNLTGINQALTTTSSPSFTTVTANLTGNASGTAATVTGAAQTAITSLGTLTALQVDNLNLNGNIISSTDTNGNITLTPNGTGYTILNGNVGIGTTTPGSLLEVAGKGQFGTAAATTSQLDVKGGASGAAMITLTRTVGVTSQWAWLLAGGGLTFLDVTNSGQSAMNIFGDNSFNATYLGQRGKTTLEPNDSLLGATTYQGGGSQTDYVGKNLTLQGGLGTGAGTLGNIYFKTGNLGSSGTTTQTASIKMTILGGGNVGIGTTGPGELLSLGTAGTTAGVLSLAGLTSGKAIIVVPSVAGTPTLTLPTVTGTLATLAGTETLTNKTIDGVTPTIMGYVDPTSSIQTQLNGKQASGAYLTTVDISANTNLAVTAPIVLTGDTLSIPAATASVNGYATSTQITKLDGIATAATANAKITGATLDSLTDDTGFVTALAVQNGHNVPHAVPGTTGNLLQSNGTDWLAVAIPTWNQNTSGTASNVSGTPALPNGTTATTQSANDNSTKIATTAYADLHLEKTGGTLTGALLFTDDTYDIGASGATRPRTGYFGTSLVVGGVAVPTISSTSTLTNKRITKREITTTDDATAVIDVDVTDQYQLTAVANATTFSTTGTPTAGQKMIIRFKDAGVAKGLTWDAVFRAVGVTLPTTTVVSKTHYVGCIFNATDTKWDVVAVVVEA